jgi:UDP-glucose 4-epimerase
LQDSAKAYGLNVISLRYFNPIGAHKTSIIGEMPHGVPTHIIPYITQVAMGIREELSIFGNDYNTPDGTCVRDYIDVNDLADAHISAVNRLLKNAHEKGVFEVYNIGTGNGVSVAQIVAAFENATGIKIKHRYAPRRAGDVTAAYADSSLAKEKLGWEAKISLEETLRSAWNWEQKQFESRK